MLAEACREGTVNPVEFLGAPVRWSENPRALPEKEPHTPLGSEPVAIAMPTGGSSFGRLRKLAPYSRHPKAFPSPRCQVSTWCASAERMASQHLGAPLGPVQQGSWIRPDDRGGLKVESRCDQALRKLVTTANYF